MTPPRIVNVTLGDVIAAWVLVGAARGVPISPDLQAILREHGTDTGAGLLLQDLDSATVAALRYAIDNAPAPEAA